MKENAKEKNNRKLAIAAVLFLGLAVGTWSAVKLVLHKPALSISLNSQEDDQPLTTIFDDEVPLDKTPDIASETNKTVQEYLSVNAPDSVISIMRSQDTTALYEKALAQKAVAEETTRQKSKALKEVKSNKSAAQNNLD